MKAPSKLESTVDESVARRLKLASLITANLGVLPQHDVDYLVTNEGRLEIPQRILKGFSTKEEISKPVELSVVSSSPVIKVLREAPKPCHQRAIADQVFDQRRLYQSLGWSLQGFCSPTIPKRQTGFDRLLVMGNMDLTNNGMFDVLKTSFPCWRCVNDLDTKIPKERDERHPSRGPYAIWVRDCIEPDEVHRNKSVNTIKEEGVKTLTALERMYYEALFYWETGKHLDQKNVTLCSGSCCLDSKVPYAYWEDKFFVDRADVGNGRENFWARQAVTL
jgi:hypothetical protein